jgi:diguanylate cyclase (GGDEF)-like protein
MQMERASVLQERFNAWLLRVGKLRVVTAITLVSTVLSVVMTGVANIIFMPDVPWEEWFYISAIVPIIISPIVSSMVLSLLYQLAEAKAALITMSETDPLTGVGNRRGFFKRAEGALARAAREQLPICIVLIDIDHFKLLNDDFGHIVGDEALIAVARSCHATLRGDDTFCRWGGEEFIALLTGISLGQACALAERLRATVATTQVRGIGRPITISLGVAQNENYGDTLDQLIAVADHYLYKAKDGGRNRVEPTGQVASLALRKSMKQRNR